MAAQDEALSEYEPEYVKYERDGNVGSVVIDRSPVNSYDGLLLWELARAWRRAAADDEARVVLLRARGKHFCVGADLSEVHREPPAGARQYPLDEHFTFVRNIMKPTIAVVQGACVGGGQHFVFACDLIFCSVDAYFLDPTASMGIGGVEAPVHAWLYGPRLAKEMIFGGLRVPAERLYNMGTVNRLVPRDELLEASMAFARDVANVEPSALRQAKRAVNATTDIMGQHLIASRFGELLDERPKMTLRRPPSATSSTG